ncbi:MAG: hypothetical protein AB1898_22190 [Acidobacteriota bacterium]
MKAARMILIFGVLGYGLQHTAEPFAADNEVRQGRLVCLDAKTQETPCSSVPAARGLKTEEGQVFPLRSGDALGTLVSEKRLRSNRFQLTLRKEQGTPFFEVIRSQILRDGKVLDFYYFCEVCNITTYAPGLCMCCREETAYHEKVAD